MKLTSSGPAIGLTLFGAVSLSDVVDAADVVLLLAERHRLVELDRLRELSVRLEVPGLVGGVLQDDVGLGVLVVPEAHQDDVRLVDPHLLPELAADVAEPLDAVEAHGLEAAVAQHLGDLGVLLAILPEHQLSLEALVLVLAAPAILASLSLVLRHLELLQVKSSQNQ